MGLPRSVALVMLCACSSASNDAQSGDDAPDAAVSTPWPDAAPVAPDAYVAPTLGSNRDRLLATYFARLKADPDTVQSNGLVGHSLADVCAVWAHHQPSARDVFLTLTHRLDGSVLSGGTTALDHVTKLYRVNGGDGATSTSAGSCGGGEVNRVILSMDPALHAALLAANTRHGAQPRDVADIPSASFWRDSHDLAGPHAPFDVSDETEGGAPRGQTQFFRDPAAANANAPLQRIDLVNLVDPYALEIDHDYDCVHSSNPLCDYTLYGTACFPQATRTGVELYTQDYGDFAPAWQPTGC